ncbi:hypothetical protein CLV85_1240 [Salinibacterium amurskyense]|uniref:Uncharacterized protein n=1 Tax=Salinibacterium amurskyense TaxID=205941 RepID=A0A2M9D8S4_9MICO|nr:hypothetical protein [Salinibacterium amurskyense]PJJ82052.1 hypothetical protein CLV85_1240 [Salinibacterium amurskyense]RLQ81835.1 hypothetical protein D9C83_06170 [Salinibacterium amurskyense]GHD78349.1 hypothetical protein GCM10007394_05830 [Salinibacterium amurskyense]
MNKKLITGAAGVVLASCVGLGIALPAQADTIETASTTVASDTTTDKTTSGEHAGRGHARGLDAAGLATKLDLTETEVSDAFAALRDSSERPERLDSDATEEERTTAKDERRAALVTALAAELNVDEDTLTAALTELRAEHEAEREANPDAGNGERGDRGDRADRGERGDRGQMGDRSGSADDSTNTESDTEE